MAARQHIECEAAATVAAATAATAAAVAACTLQELLYALLAEHYSAFLAASKLTEYSRTDVHYYRHKGICMSLNTKQKWNGSQV